MKTGWQIKTLGEVCDILDSKRRPVTKKDRISGDYPYYGATGIVDYVANYIFDERLVLVGEDGAKWQSGERTAFIVDGQYWVNNHAHVLRPHHNVILHEWIEYYFFIKDLSEYITGVTVPKLNQAKLRSIEIPIPPLSEQERIVKMLNEKFEVIEKLKKVTDKQLADVKELFESELNNELSQLLAEKELVQMSDIYDVRDGTHDSPKYHKEGRALVTSKNLKDGKLLLDNVKYISESDYIEICKRSGVSVGDVLFAMIGTIGNPVVITQEPDFAIKNVALFKVPNEQSSEFLRYYLLSNYVKDKMVRESKGATQKFVGLGYLRSFLIPQVDYKEQVRIVSKLNGVAEQLNQLRKIYQGKVIDFEELKKSYLEQAFSGKL